ncbi:carnitine O-acetyltransferase-like isoform X1 [Megalops cyprinoides]|uniref:carnitine O-acetyltransferase-like isoform X1 n=1 Tax=Megalops cyprinoides TaxID=118141 RepID=UPI001864B853|nr:carnitine O-acetyltransferase-like isoform X1 [Megalops cyprinoides]
MLGLLARTMGKASLVKPSALVKPVSVTKIAGRYLAHQEGLPKLPVPPLKQTCERYLAVLEPIISEEELSHTRQLMSEFLRSGGVGERLQKGLERRARKTENWLSDWWLQTAYLEFRMPVVVYSSPGVVLPKQEFHDRQGQIRFAAKLIAGVLDFKTMIDNETLPVEYLGGKPLCMNQYYQVLSSCRIPGPKRDTVVNHALGKRPPTHITVVHNFQFFVLDVYNSDGTPLTVDQIYIQLEKIWNSSLQTNKEPIGILTSQHRNTWGKAYNNLIKDKTNKESVRAIQKSIFTVCLDAPIPRVSDDLYRSRAAVQMLHGGGSRWNSGNRWFDKTLQFIIGEDGTCGLIYEHAPAEGPPIVSLVDHVVEYTKKSEMVRSPMVPLPMPQKLRFNITPEIKKDIEKAKQNMNIMVHDLDVKVIVFTHFGKNFPKSQRMSPDAFIQMALQLAYFRMYQTCCSTYESASLRMFRLGRTDTIRSASIDSLNFVRGMDDPTKQVRLPSGNPVSPQCPHLLGVCLLIVCPYQRRPASLTYCTVSACTARYLLKLFRMSTLLRITSAVLPSGYSLLISAQHPCLRCPEMCTKIQREVISNLSGSCIARHVVFLLGFDTVSLYLQSQFPNPLAATAAAVSRNCWVSKCPVASADECF